MNKKENTLTARYSMCQASYWMAVCGINGFASVFLLAKQFTSGEIGVLLAWGNIIAAVLQPLVAGAVDKNGRLGLKEWAILTGMVGASATLGLYLIPGSMAVMAGFYIIAITSAMVLQPLVNAIGVYYMNQGQSLNYGLARAMGSVAYAVLSTLLGILVEQYGEDILMLSSMLFYLVLVLAVGTMKIKKDDGQKKTEKKDIGIQGFVTKYKRFSVMLVGLVFLFVFHFFSNSYTIQIIENVGGGSKEMGTAVSVAALVELPVMIFFTPLVKKFGAGKLLKISGVFFVLKAVLTYAAGNVMGVYVAQMCQMLSFAVYAPASVYYANQVMDPEDTVKGQAMMTATFTVGAVVGNYLGGKLIEWSGVKAMLLAGIVSTVIGMGVLFVAIPREERAMRKE